MDKADTPTHDQSGDETLQKLGMVIGNLWALEFLMRLFLSGGRTTPPPPSAERARPSVDFFALRPGDEVPATDLSSYDSLSEVLEKYNRAVAVDLQVDPTVVDLRDCLAHGRVLMKTPDSRR